MTTPTVSTPRRIFGWICIMVLTPLIALFALYVLTPLSAAFSIFPLLCVPKAKMDSYCYMDSVRCRVFPVPAILLFWANVSLGWSYFRHCLGLASAEYRTGFPHRYVCSHL